MARGVKDSPKARALLSVWCALFAAAGCGRDRVTGPTYDDVVLLRVSGDGQRASGFARLEFPLVVRAAHARSGLAVAGVPVRFAVERGAVSGAALLDTLAATDGDGLAATELTLGDDGVDTVTVLARAPRGAAVRFTVVVAAAPAVRTVSPPSFAAGDTVALIGSGLGLAAAPGAVRFGEVRVQPLWVSDTLVRVVVPACLAPGFVSVSVVRGWARSRAAPALHVVRAAPVSLRPHNGVTLRASSIEDCAVLDGAGARYLVVPHFGFGASAAEALDVELGAGAPLAAFAANGAAAARGDVPLRFEAALRRREAALAAADVAPERGRARWRAPSASVGEIRSFRVIANIDATAFTTVRARLAFSGSNVSIWVDTASPAELPADSLERVARVFDRDLYPLAVGAFGETSDVDGDGAVHVVLSPVVNALTPRGFCSLSGFVAAFFSAHDLYPGSLEANGGEFIYGFVPDSTGRYGCPHSVSEFTRVIRPVFIHELQHAINYHQHVLRRGGREEEVWLNEGLSHAAEELGSKYYEARYPWPAGRTSPDQLFPDSAGGFILFNLINAYLFLRQPYAHSLTGFRGGGTIEERGAAWLFVRWLADQYGEDILRRLVQTSLRGEANVVDKTAVPFEESIGDFAIAVYADSLPGLPRTSVPPQWRFRTRNWRQLFQRLHEIANFPPFPIDPLPVPFGGTVRGTLRGGGFVFLTVDVPVDEPRTVLRFRRLDGAPWLTGHAPRVTVFRLR